jgi:hypothetical protein
MLQTQTESKTRLQHMLQTQTESKTRLQHVLQTRTESKTRLQHVLQTQTESKTRLQHMLQMQIKMTFATHVTNANQNDVCNTCYKQIFFSNELVFTKNMVVKK